MDGIGRISDLNERRAEGIRRARSRSAITAQRRFQAFVSEVTGSILAAPGDHLDLGIQRGIRAVARLARAPRSWMAIVNKGSAYGPRFREWYAHGMMPLHNYVRGMPEDATPWFAEQFRALKKIRLKSRADLPPGSERERMLLERIGIEALAAVPITAGGPLIAVGLAAHAPRLWDEDTMTALTLLGSSVANMLERRQTERKLVLKRACRQTFFRILPYVFFRVASDGTVADCEIGKQSDYRLAPEEVVGRSILELFPDSARGIFQEALSQVLHDRRLTSFDTRVETGVGLRPFTICVMPLLEDEALVTLQLLSDGDA